jgi:hypothetical protein
LPLIKISVPPLARPLNPAASLPALSICRIPLAGLRRGLASYQQLAGNDPGYKAITNWLSWVNQHNLYTIWYAGYVAARSDIFVNVSVAQFTAYVQQIAALPGAQGGNIYINIANEPMHGTGLAANNRSDAFIEAMGGKGTTGYDWLVNIGKIFRQYFPKAR